MFKNFPNSFFGLAIIVLLSANSYAGDTAKPSFWGGLADKIQKILPGEKSKSPSVPIPTESDRTSNVDQTEKKGALMVQVDTGCGNLLNSDGSLDLTGQMVFTRIGVVYGSYATKRLTLRKSSPLAGKEILLVTSAGEFEPDKADQTQDVGPAVEVSLTGDAIKIENMETTEAGTSFDVNMNLQLATSMVNAPKLRTTARMKYKAQLVPHKDNFCKILIHGEANSENSKCPNEPLVTVSINAENVTVPPKILFHSAKFNIDGDNMVEMAFAEAKGRSTAIGECGEKVVEPRISGR